MQQQVYDFWRGRATTVVEFTEEKWNFNKRDTILLTETGLPNLNLENHIQQLF